MTATLDTSGAVYFATPYAKEHGLKTFYRWADLSPLERGYVECVCRAAEDTLGGFTVTGIRFSDLAAETLAAILKDCAGLAAIYSDTKQGGALFWADRKRGSFQGLNPDTRFPPLTVAISDAWKVVFQ